MYMRPVLYNLAMRNRYVLLVLLIILLTGIHLSVFAQKKTIILARHAEKDMSAAADPDNPDLSAEGRGRAENLAKRIKGYRVGAVYSTDYRRTRETAEPSAKRRGKEIKIYNAKNQQVLVNEILGSKTKRFLIIGHSNTIPPLANLLMKKELFKNLDEGEFGTIWVIKLRSGRPPSVRVISY